MRAVVQRVSRCSVTVDGAVVSSIRRGLLVLLGVHRDDSPEDVRLLARKCAGLRIFPDDDGRMNRSVTDVDGEAIVVSQFTLFGDIRRGLRPFFGEAAEPEPATDLYNRFKDELAGHGVPVQGGVFAAHMHVDLVNDGPVTIIMDTREM